MITLLHRSNAQCLRLLVLSEGQSGDGNRRGGREWRCWQRDCVGGEGGFGPGKADYWGLSHPPKFLILTFGEGVKSWLARLGSLAPNLADRHDAPLFASNAPKRKGKMKDDAVSARGLDCAISCLSIS